MCLRFTVQPAGAVVPETVFGKAELATAALGLVVGRAWARDARVVYAWPLLVGIGVEGKLVGLARAAAATLPHLVLFAATP